MIELQKNPPPTQEVEYSKYKNSLAQEQEEIKDENCSIFEVKVEEASTSSSGSDDEEILSVLEL